MRKRMGFHRPELIKGSLMLKKFNHGLFIGRFQPFHKGHLYALEVASSLCKELVIGIGSSQETGTKINPLSSKIRIKIITAGLGGTKIDAKELKFIEIPDSASNDAWFNYIIRRDPDIEVVFSRNGLVKKIFRSHNIPVISPKWYERRRLMAAKIRGLIKKEKAWKDRVPEGAVREIAAHASAIKRARGQIITKRR